MAVLADVLRPGLKVVFCGTRPGTRSAAAGAYYAGPGNRFWPMLAGLGLVPPDFDPLRFETVWRYGIGLTDLCKTTAGPDASIRAGDFDVAGLVEAIGEAAPARLAFNGKRAAAAALDCPSERLIYGRQTGRIAGAVVHVLPSTSGAARAAWSPAPWAALARDILAADT
ncbi:mismatch-specific DNA-glycosylase [Prosthecodimorpha staleyi]|uniref:Mismatch-specific DNA-glycosylase n=1 Tax=Prosthecodimorpha staleyi TaxID=2840188 RepID=A0A947D5L8_9HYPH|nr:mismatch-specific DNA-glycosylase [Prosthecodimorpha staleyi]MBT9288577.1 mismatch-specific DNA-glycosylase [Prosthecodimorpha staleyi]